MNSILRLSFLALILNFSIGLFAQTELTIHVETPGTLAKLIFGEVDDDMVIEKLTVTGTLNGDDMRKIRYMCGRSYEDESTNGLLTFLDMGGADFIAEKRYSFKGYTLEVGVIGYYMFEKTNLETIIIPKSIVEIEVEAFYSCSKLKKVVLPEGLKTINSRTFRDCVLLEDINLPSTLIDIHSSAFNNTALKSICIPSGITWLRERVFSNCRNLEKVELSEGVRTIDNRVFENCIGLTEIILPSTVNRIDEAFKGCTSIKTVVSLRPTPPGIYSGTFDNEVYQKATLYVPSEGMDAYLRASGWINFMRVTEGTPSSVSTIGNDNIRISVNGDKVLIAGTALGDVINVYTVGGSLVKSVSSQDRDVEIELIPGTVYLVKVGERTYKVGV